jgi:Bifunctional DNA primase/polymerase, N-terminal
VSNANATAPLNTNVLSMNYGRRLLMKEFRIADSAEALAQLGLSVIRLHGVVDGRCTCGTRGCGTPGKHPDVGPSWKRFTQEHADLALVRRWFTEKPYANVGIVTGQISEVLVLDADGEAGVTGLERRGYPTTWTARSGSGGLHLYFRHPGYRVGNRKVARIGDLRGDGGLIVAPPSLHISGERYEWLSGRSPW